MYNGIVFNEIQRNAFLSIAANENLICEKGMSDGIYKRITQYCPSYQFTKEIFEQFIVAGTIYIDPFVYKFLDGDLIEKEIIKPYEKERDKELEFVNFDISIIRKMLEERNYNIGYYTEEKITKIFNELKEKTLECIELETKYCFKYNKLVIDNIFIKAGLFEQFENKEKVNDYLKLKSSILKNPVYIILEEYVNMLNIAFNNDLLCPVTNHSGIRTNNNMLESDTAIKILKYTSERLNRINIANTIKDNVNLIQSAEAQAYRKKVNEWLNALSKQNFDNMGIIEDEITIIQKSMKHKKWIENTGKICATVGVAASLLAHSTIGLGASIIAEIATYVGAPTAFYDSLKSNKYLWASFGVKL